VAILSASKKESCKTRIMYDVNMNLASFNKYLRELTRAGLIAKVGNPQNRIVYRITDRGIDLLQLLEKADQFISL